MTTVWGLHSRPNDNLAYQFFIDKGYIGIAWARFGNMALIDDDFNVFAAIVQKHWPTVDYRPYSGTCHRFVYVAAPGDVVVYPSPIDDDTTLHIGIVTGKYQHSPQINFDCPDLRKVDWRITTTRDKFRPEQLISLKSRLTFYEMHESPKAFIDALEAFE